MPLECLPKMVTRLIHFFPWSLASCLYRDSEKEETEKQISQNNQQQRLEV